MKKIFLMLLVLAGSSFGSGINSLTSNAIELQGFPIATTTPAGSVCLVWGGSSWGPASCTGTGGVTSVAMTVPSFLSISGSPITSTGTLALTLSGTALPVANGGTGATSATAALTSLGAASTVLGNLGTTAVNADINPANDNANDLGTYSGGSGTKRWAHIWAATAVIGGTSGLTYLAENTLHFQGGPQWIYAGNEMEFQIGGTTYLFIESNTVSDYGSLTIGGSVDGTTAGYVTQNYSVPLATQVHASAALSAQLDLSSGFGMYQAGLIGLANNGIKSMLTDPANNIMLGIGSLATSAVAPFPYVPTMAGPPSGVPATTTYYFNLSTTSGSITAGAQYTNNGATFTVLASITLGAPNNFIICTGTGAPSASGTLTKSSGTGTTPLAFTAVTTNTISGMAPEVLDTTDGKLWFYYGGAWHYITAT